MNANFQAPPDNRTQKIFFLAALILVCFNLRTGFSAPDSLLHRIELDLHLSLEGSGTFAILPVFVLGIAAPLSPHLARYMAPGKLVFLFLLVAAAGMMWRSYGGSIGLYGGMIVMALGLGIAGALIPGIVKKHFAARQSLMMGVYSALVSLGTSAGAAGAVPAANLLGSWNAGLAVWVIPLVISALFWETYQVKYGGKSAKSTLNTKITRLLSSRGAWDVTLFYTTRVACSYFLFTWLPILLKGRGMQITDAGFILSLATLTEIPAALTAHTLDKKLGGHGRVVALSLILSGICCWGFMYAPLTWAIPLSVIFGLSLGALFSRGMALMVERTRDETTSVELSGMSQGIGFTMGAILAVAGSLFVHPSGSLWPFCLVYTIFCLAGVIYGLRASRPDPI